MNMDLCINIQTRALNTTKWMLKDNFFCESFPRHPAVQIQILSLDYNYGLKVHFFRWCKCYHIITIWFTCVCFRTNSLCCSILSFHVDCSVPSFLQHLRHPAVVSSSFHASADKNGPCAWWAHCQIPLVCSLVPSSLLLTPSISGPGSLAGWLEGDGWRWGSFPGRHHLHHHG